MSIHLPIVSYFTPQYSAHVKPQIRSCVIIHDRKFQFSFKPDLIFLLDKTGKPY